MKKILLLTLMAVLAIANVGEVTVVKGEAYVYRDKSDLEAQNKMGLLKLDIVQTKAGRLQMQFIDNTVISLGRESRFRIKEYLYQENSNDSVASFELESGFIKTITGAISKLMPENFVLHTKSTKIVSNGTIWSVMIDNESEEYNVIEGRITLSFKSNGKEKSVSLKAGESIRLETASKNVTKVTKKSPKTSQMDKELERNTAIIAEQRFLNDDTSINSDGNIVFTDDSVLLDSEGDPVFDDGNNGHGNDPDGLDPSNPGKKK